MASSKFKVFVTRNVPQKAIQMLKAENSLSVTHWARDDAIPRDELKRAVVDIDALFCLLTEKIDADLLNCAKRLRVIGTMSVGYDHIDVPECTKRGIQLGYTPNVLTEATAELTMALLLCTSRRIIEANKNVRNGGWGTWGPVWMCGQGLQHSTVGIVGMGRIGLSVAQKIRAFNPAKILYHDVRTGGGCDAMAHFASADSIAERVDLDTLLRESDFVTIHLALNQSTRHMFNTEVFHKMKSNAVLVNTSRGPLVDQKALYDALKSGQIAAAGLDVCDPEPMALDDPLLTLENCVVLPHIGSATMHSREAMATLTATNILNALKGKPMKEPIPL